MLCAALPCEALPCEALPCSSAFMEEYFKDEEIVLQWWRQNLELEQSDPTVGLGAKVAEELTAEQLAVIADFLTGIDKVRKGLGAEADEGAYAMGCCGGHCPEARALDFVGRDGRYALRMFRRLRHPDIVLFHGAAPLRETLILHWSWNASRA